MAKVEVYPARIFTPFIAIMALPFLVMFPRSLAAQTRTPQNWVATWTIPFKRFNGWTEQGEANRLAANRWIKESRAFDGVIDFSAALTDPQDPARLVTRYDSGDHLHPNSAGHEAMVRAIDLSLFK